MRQRTALIGLALCWLGFVGCHLVSDFDADTIETTERKTSNFVQESTVKGVDLLIVVDTSSATQLAELESGLELLVTEVVNAQGMWQSVDYGNGVGPDSLSGTVHVGFVSSDMGTPFTTPLPAGCTDVGHGAALIHPELPPGHAGYYLQPFLVLGSNWDDPMGEGAITVLNHRDLSGDASEIPFSEALAHHWAGVMSMASSCPYQQPLNVARRALEYNVENLGFHRTDAALGLLIVSPSDDCSANYDLWEGGLFSVNPSLGPLGVFRCFEHGVQCAGDDRRSPGVQTDCQDLPPFEGEGTDVRLMRPALSHQAAFRALKGSRPFIAAAVSGSTDHVEVGLDNSGHPQLLPSSDCSDATLLTHPAVRLQSFASSDPSGDVLFSSLCEVNWQELGYQFSSLFENQAVERCLGSDLVNTEPIPGSIRPDCTVRLVANPGTAQEQVVATPQHCEAVQWMETCWIVYPGMTCPAALYIETMPMTGEAQRYDLVEADCAYHLP